MACQLARMQAVHIRGLADISFSCYSCLITKGTLAQRVLDVHVTGLISLASTSMPHCI